MSTTRTEVTEMRKRPYVCTGCGASGVKLWREYQTFADRTVLECVDCAIKSQAKEDKITDVREDGTHLSLITHSRSDAIGWRVPAVPAEGETFWGYTSVPDDAVAWWKALPLRARTA